MFLFWVCIFYFFGNFILYMNLYITHTFESIDHFLFDSNGTKERQEAGLALAAV